MRFSIKLLAIPALAAIGFFGFTGTASAATASFGPTGGLQNYGPTGGLHPCTATSIHCKGDTLVLTSVRTPVPNGHDHGGQGDDRGNGNHGNGGDDGHGGSRCFDITQVGGPDWNQFTQNGHGHGCGHDSRGNCGCRTQTITFTSSHRGHVFTETSGPVLHTGEVITIGGQTFTVTWTDGYGHFALNGNPRIRHQGQAQTVCTSHGHDHGDNGHGDGHGDNGHNGDHGHGPRDGGPVQGVTVS